MKTDRIIKVGSISRFQWGITPMLTTFPESVLKEKWFIELIRGHIMDEKQKEEKKKTVIHLPKDAKGKTMRIRKLTPRECFRLMDVPEEKIDLMSARGKNGEQVISNSRLYHLAGNSIVVNCMAKMFENLFYGCEPAEGEQFLLF